MSIHDVYIKTVKVQNYKSLESASITLNKGLNIIIGDNGAGKSNFLSFLGKPLTESIFALIFGRSFNEYARLKVIYTIELEYKDEDDFYEVQIKNTNSATNEHQSQLSFVVKRNGIPELDFPTSDTSETKAAYIDARTEVIKIATNLKSTFIRFNLPSKLSFISNSGRLTLTGYTSIVAEQAEAYGMPSYISPLFINLESDIELHLPKASPYQQQDLDADTIKSTIFKWFNEKKKENDYAATLEKFTPINDIQLNENINVYHTGSNWIIENIVLNFKVNDDWVPWSYLSDGTARLFHIITEVLFSANHIVLIEEPELGIHPNQLFKLLEFLNEQSEKKQILISTHSPITLDVLAPDQLDQIIIAKMTKKGTTFRHLDADQKSKGAAYILEVGKLSEYWLHSDLEE